MDDIDTTTYRRTCWSDKKDLVYSPLRWHHPCTLVHHSTSSQNLPHASPVQLAVAIHNECKPLRYEVTMIRTIVFLQIIL